MDKQELRDKIIAFVNDLDTTNDEWYTSDRVAGKDIMDQFLKHIGLDPISEKEFNDPEEYQEKTVSFLPSEEVRIDMREFEINLCKRSKNV